MEEPTTYINPTVAYSISNPCVAAMAADAQKITSILAHDVINPISSLKNIIDLQSSGLIETDELMEMLPKFIAEADHVMHLVTNVSAFTKVFGNMQAPQHDLELRHLQTAELVAIKEKCLAKQNEYAAAIPGSATVRTYQPAVQFILENLLHNAYKFTENGKITVSYKNFDDKHWLQVSDTGVGIKPADLEAIMGAKSTFTTRGTRNEKGSGLGIYFIKEIQQALQKAFVLESEPGKGTTALFEM